MLYSKYIHDKRELGRTPPRDEFPKLFCAIVGCVPGPLCCAASLVSDYIQNTACTRVPYCFHKTIIIK